MSRESEESDLSKDTDKPSAHDEIQANTNASSKSSDTHKATTPSVPIDIKNPSQTNLRKPSSLELDAGEDSGNEDHMPLILKTANTMSSMMMAHRIALEDDFRLEPGLDMSGPLMSLSPIIGSSPIQGGSSETPSLQSKVKEIVHEAYWDSLKEELTTQTTLTNGEDKKFDMSLQLLSDIRQKMIDLLLPQHTRLKQDIEDRLDLDIVARLCKNNSFDLREYAKYILSVLSKLCAPVRDEKIQELTETTDLIQLYRGILELLEMMRLDFANFTLNRFKPHIKAHSHEYEREKFNEILKQQQIIGIDGLEFTKVWLARAVDRFDSLNGLSDYINDDSLSSKKDLDLEESTSSPILETATTSSNHTNSNSLTPSDKVLKSGIIDKVLNSAYCELLEWSPELQKLYPETLLFDEATFKQLGEQVKTLILTSSILLITFAFLNRFKLPDLPDFKSTIKSHIITLLTASYDNRSLTSTDSPTKGNSKSALAMDESLDQGKLETIVVQLKSDIKQRISTIDESLVAGFESQSEMFRQQILDVLSSSNRVRELARRRIIEFVETLLGIDAKHHGNKSSKSIPPVNIPLGLNCMSDEITLTMAQLVRIIRYNRRVFYKHYQDIMLDMILKKL